MSPNSVEAARLQRIVLPLPVRDFFWHWLRIGRIPAEVHHRQEGLSQTLQWSRRFRVEIPRQRCETEFRRKQAIHTNCNIGTSAFSFRSGRSVRFALDLVHQDSSPGALPETRVQCFREWNSSPTVAFPGEARQHGGVDVPERRSLKQIETSFSGSGEIHVEMANWCFCFN